MGRKFDDDGDDYLELLGEYERYLQKNIGAYDDFDEWLEITYGSSKKKAFNRTIKKHRPDGDRE